jgi:hypothetical protein
MRRVHRIGVAPDEAGEQRKDDDRARERGGVDGDEDSAEDDRAGDAGNAERPPPGDLAAVDVAGARLIPPSGLHVVDLHVFPGSFVDSGP